MNTNSVLNSDSTIWKIQYLLKGEKQSSSCDESWCGEHNMTSCTTSSNDISLSLYQVRIG